MAAARKTKEDPRGRFQLDGEIVEFDLDGMTFGEAEEIEVYFDRPLDGIDFESGRGLMFIAYLAKKRRDPDTTLDDIRALKISAVQEAAPERPTKQVPENDGTQS